MIKHNVFLQPQGDKVICVTVLPLSVFGTLPNQAYIIANTSQNIYTGMNPSINLNLNEVIDAEDFAKMMDMESPKGMGIAGVITEGVWFCQHVSSPLKDLQGDKL